ncbi:uncharacterized protein LOC115057210 [Echeneis naucrates]|uniref:uncharacterized protein LOC115057210 n=1 Tax=Echeneis naucrates TaxID=173247 RepID=UPI0011136A3F|nr:uncharacterized protein LOC115057210 [Echeneis naucrates]
MPQKDSFNPEHALLLFLLIFGVSWKHAAAQESREEATEPSDGDAFFALRSCHQQLVGDSGEFFSPDYLCSNPSLWCNWTIRAAPGQRIHLQLEDFTPDDSCHLKQDQIHVDDPAAHSWGHRVLQKCWREAKYTSSSNALDVVLLIGAWPHSPYRGFYGRYQAFGPPVVYNPQEAFSVRDRKSEPEPGLMGLAGEQVGSDPSGNSGLMFDYPEEHSAPRTEPLLEPEYADPEADENLHLDSGTQSQVNPTSLPSTRGTSRPGRDVTHPPQILSHSAVHHESSKPNQTPPTAVRRDVEEASDETRSEQEEPDVGSGKALDGEDWIETSDQHPSSPEGLEAHPHPNMVELLSEHRGSLNVRNHSETLHLPGDHLFEAAVEVNFSQDLEESWDSLARSLLLSVKTLISEQLETLNTPLSMSSKRIKRLNAGALYILWLQIGPGPGSSQVHRAVHAAMQGLIATSVGLRGIHRKAVIISVSTADVNECGTQLVLCDVNADCVNQFGSYSCHCRPGFLDRSRLGSGGTVCVDVKAAGCSSGLSGETKGVYVLFFLLSSLVLMLLAAAGTLYHRHRRGMFLVRCHSNSSMVPPPDRNNNHHQHRHNGYSVTPDSDLPPPPPPSRGPRESWPPAKERSPAVDLPLLRFSALLPPDGYMEPREGGKMCTD